MNFTPACTSIMPVKLGRFGKFGFYKRAYRSIPNRTNKYSKAAIAKAMKGQAQRISQDTITRVLCANGTVTMAIPDNSNISGTGGTVPTIL